jgi:hypothetical protein
MGCPWFQFDQRTNITNYQDFFIASSAQWLKAWRCIFPITGLRYWLDLS